MTVVFGQNRHLIDSIKHKLIKAEEKKRFDLLNDLAWEYRFANPDTTVFYASQASALAKSLKLTRGLARSENFIGIAYNYKGERLKAFEHYSKALEVGTQQNDSVQIAHANNNIGRLFYEQGLLSRSYEYYVRALAIFDAIKDSSGLAYAYQSLANLYKIQHDYKKAESNFLKAYKIRLSLGNSRDIMSALVYIGRLYNDSEQPDKSIRYFELADSTGRVINDEINLAEIQTLLAEGYLAKGLLQQAEKMCGNGLKVILDKNNYRMMPQAYLTMGQIQFAKKDFVNAKKYFSLSLDLANRIKDLNAKMEAYFFLWKVAERENNEAEKVKNQNQYLILKDSIKDLDLARQVERLQFEIEIERKEKENELLKANGAKDSAIIEQQKLQNIGLIVVVSFVSILGVLQYLNGKKRRLINEKLLIQNEKIEKQRQEIVEQNEKLSRRNQQLSDLNHEKDTLMSIVAHDLKSPLNRMDGILYLMEIDGNLKPEHRHFVNLLKNASRAGLDLITDLLDVHMLEENVEPNYTTFDISNFLLEKTESFEPVAEAKNIQIRITRIENEDITTDRDYLSRIMDNLLSNAVKFSPKNSIIDIAGDKTDSEFWISIKDLGPGFSKNDRSQLFQKFRKLSARPTAGETSNGLGLAIVKILVDRLKGNIDLKSEPTKGSEFVIRFPQETQA